MTTKLRFAILLCSICAIALISASIDSTTNILKETLNVSKVSNESNVKYLKRGVNKSENVLNNSTTISNKYLLNQKELENIQRVIMKRRQNPTQRKHNRKPSRSRKRRRITQQKRQLKLLLETKHDARSKRTKRDTKLLSSEDADCDSLPLRHARVFLTVNMKPKTKRRLLAGASGQRFLEMNWELPQNMIQNFSNDWIGLFKGKPTERETTKLLQRINPTEHPSGYYKTQYKIRRTPNFEKKHDRCVQGFWIAYLKNNTVLRMNCLQIRPRWMWEERDVIGNMPLNSLMIPGTHNSGSYIRKGSNGNLLKRYSSQQAEDTWDQLLYGIRYLDFRVSYHRNTAEKFWLNHDLVQMNPLYNAIQDVRRYLSATKEIIIMDFHRFPDGFKNNSLHTELVSYIMQELGDFMAPDHMGPDVTPNELWKANKTLIVTYGNIAQSAFNSLLWPEVEQAWGDARNERELYSFLTDRMISRSRGGPSNLWAAMTHLTPTPWQFLSQSTGGFRFLSDSIARKATKWYRDEWWSTANIVASDFFLGNNLIEESLRSNRKRSKDCPYYVPQKRHSNQPTCSNQNCQNVTSFDMIATEHTNVNRNENEEQNSSNSNESSSWLSWFGF